MAIEKKIKTEKIKLCPTKITKSNPAGMYETIDFCRCEICVGLGFYFIRSEDKIEQCPMYEELCDKFYKKINGLEVKV